MNKFRRAVAQAKRSQHHAYDAAWQAMRRVDEAVRAFEQIENQLSTEMKDAVKQELKLIREQIGNVCSGAWPGRLGKLAALVNADRGRS